MPLALIIFLQVLSYQAFCSQSSIRIKDYVLEIPSGWSRIQSAQDGPTLIHNFVNKNDVVAIVAYKKPLPPLSDFLSKGISVGATMSETYGALRWERTISLKQTPSLPHYVSSFVNHYRGYTYFGYARSSGLAIAEKNARSFLKNLIKSVPCSLESCRSLTEAGYPGKKFYIGFGEILPGSMGNEVKFDIQHTHDVFTKAIGGNYEGTTFIEEEGAEDLRSKWNDLQAQMKKEDMYVQYSSGHGGTGGLAFGVSYDEIRDRVLSFPSKENIIFLMACHSGGLVESFNRKRKVWQNWEKEGRTLFVMSSSQLNEPSSAGPGTDPEEGGGPVGSAGSAYGHALWKALIGHADGHEDGVTDGFISLGEIRSYVTQRTKELGDHTPAITGVFQPSLIMNRVPSHDELARLGIQLYE
jgi:hypothetical protein